MSRRDTIIIAVLLNVAILSLLFIMAVNRNEDVISEQSEIAHEIASSKDRPADREETSYHFVTAAGSDLPSDEVDDILSDFVAIPSIHQDLSEDEVILFSEESSLNQSSPSGKFVSAGKFVEIKVKKGDALERIARANGTSVEAIKSANGLKHERLTIGQVLKIPVDSLAHSDANKVSEAKAVTTAKTPLNNDSSEAKYYTVKSGDNPWKIAKQAHMRVDDLIKLNNLDEEKARNLKIGDKIRIQ